MPPGTCADASPETAFSVGLRKRLGKGRVEVRVRTVDGDAHEIADLLDLAASKPDRAQIPEDEVVVSAASLQSVAVADERGGQSAACGPLGLLVLLIRPFAQHRVELGLRNADEVGVRDPGTVTARAGLAALVFGEAGAVNL